MSLVATDAPFTQGHIDGHTLIVHVNHMSYTINELIEFFSCKAVISAKVLF